MGQVSLAFNLANGVPATGVTVTLEDAELCQKVIQEVTKAQLFSEPKPDGCYAWEPIPVTTLAEVLAVDISALREEADYKDETVVCDCYLWGIVTPGWAVIRLSTRIYGDRTLFFRANDRSEYHQFFQSNEMVLRDGHFKMGTVFYEVGSKHWPLPVFNCASEGFQTLAQLLEPGEANPLTGLLRADGPAKTLAIQVRDSLIKIARQMLEAPIK